MSQLRSDPSVGARLRFSVVIPAHNEEGRIGAVLQDFVGAFSDSEVIVVLNGCSDGTRPIVDAIAARSKNLRVIQIDDAVGKGGAVRAGFLVARAPVVAYVDADGATSAREMRRLCEMLGPHEDGLIASRWINGAAISARQTFRRQIASRCFNAIVRVLFGLPYLDTQCGAKVFRASAIKTIVHRVETSNFAFDVDLLIEAKRQGLSIKEVATNWSDVDGSTVHLVKASSRMLAAVLRLRLRRSILRFFVPLFDRLVPTRPVRSHAAFRILIINWRDPEHPRAGGAETYLFEIGRRWVRAGNEVEWLTAGFPGAARTANLDGIKVTRVGNAASVYFLVPLEYLRHFHDRFDVIIDAENGIPFFSPLFSMKAKLCLVFHVHTEIFRRHLRWPISEVFVWIERWLMPRVYCNTNFVTIGRDTLANMRAAKFSRRPIALAYSGVDASLCPGEKAKIPTVLYLGRLENPKRIDLLIHAFKDVLEHVPDANLRIAGAGEARASLEREVENLGLSRSVTFDGFVDEQRKLELLQSAWVFCTPSLMEGWGISVVEANACGTPAVAFSVPGLREIIIDGKNGSLVPEGGSLGPGLVDIITDDALRERLEVGALDRAKDFSWDATAERMFAEIVRAVIGDWLGLVRLDDGWALVKNLTEPHPADDKSLVADLSKVLIDV